MGRPFFICTYRDCLNMRICTDTNNLELTPHWPLNCTD